MRTFSIETTSFGNDQNGIELSLFTSNFIKADLKLAKDLKN